MKGWLRKLPRLEVKAVYNNGQPIPENPGYDIYRSGIKEVVRKDNYARVREKLQLLQYFDCSTRKRSNYTFPQKVNILSSDF